MRCFIAPGRREQQELAIVAEGSRHDAGSTPHGADFVVSQDALAGVFRRLAAPHSADDGTPEVLVPDGVPVADPANDSQHGVRLCGAIIVLDGVQQSDYVFPANVSDRPLPKRRKYQSREVALPVFSTAQPSTITLEELCADRLQRICRSGTLLVPGALFRDTWIDALLNLIERVCGFPTGCGKADPGRQCQLARLTGEPIADSERLSASRLHNQVQPALAAIRYH
jgi:hypothetical protein